MFTSANKFGLLICFISNSSVVLSLAKVISNGILFVKTVVFGRKNCQEFQRIPAKFITSKTIFSLANNKVLELPFDNLFPECMFSVVELVESLFFTFFLIFVKVLPVLSVTELKEERAHETLHI